MLHQDNDERRHYFRIDDELTLAWRTVDAGTLEALLGRAHANLTSGFGYGAALAELGQETRALALQLRGEHPLMVRYLELIERKLDLVANALLLREIGDDELRPHRVNLGVGGLEFDVPERLAPGTLLELRFVAMPARTGIVAGGRVLRSDPAEGGGQRIAVEFTHLRDGDRQLIARHVMHREAEQLRALRQQRLEA